jgi:hypothetical protein
MVIYHYNKVDLKKIVANFTADELHRSSLWIPFMNRPDGKTLCIVGQNPSDAGALVADKTIRYLEEFVFNNLPQYSSIMMLNLFSRIDTRKIYQTDLIRLSCERKLREIIQCNSDFLIVQGKLKDEDYYKFKKRARQIHSLLNKKTVLKIDIETNFAPHPGNPRILYNKFGFHLVGYDFSDAY